MAIRLERSSVADQALGSLVRWFVDELFDGGLPPSWIGLRPERCALSYPVPLVDLTIGDVLAKRTLTEERQTGWLSLVMQDGEPFGAIQADLVGDELVLGELNRGPYVSSLVEAASRAENLEKVRSGDFMLSILRVPAAVITCLLLRGEEEILVPVAPSFLPAIVDWSIIYNSLEL